MQLAQLSAIILKFVLSIIFVHQVWIGFDKWQKDDTTIVFGTLYQDLVEFPLISISLIDEPEKDHLSNNKSLVTLHDEAESERIVPTRSPPTVLDLNKIEIGSSINPLDSKRMLKTKTIKIKDKVHPMSSSFFELSFNIKGKVGLGLRIHDPGNSFPFRGKSPGEANQVIVNKNDTNFCFMKFLVSWKRIRLRNTKELSCNESTSTSNSYFFTSCYYLFMEKELGCKIPWSESHRPGLSSFCDEENSGWKYWNLTMTLMDMNDAELSRLTGCSIPCEYNVYELKTELDVCETCEEVEVINLERVHIMYRSCSSGWWKFPIEKNPALMHKI